MVCGETVNKQLIKLMLVYSEMFEFYEYLGKALSAGHPEHHNGSLLGDGEVGYLCRETTDQGIV